MKDNSVLNKVRELLGMEVKLGTRKLDDGVTTIEAEEFEAGFQVVIVTEDEQKIPLPVGEYKLEDGLMLIVTEEGLIAEIKEAEEEVEEEVVEEEAKKDEEYKDEEEEVEASEEAKPVKKTVESIVKETFFSEMEALKKENEELKSELEKLSKVENNENTNEEVVEESTEEVVELSKEVEAAAKPITHNPENKIANADGFKYSPNRRRSTLDRVMQKLSK